MICNIGKYDIDMTQVAAVGPAEDRRYCKMNEEQSVYAVYLKGGDPIVIEESDKPREEFVRMWKNPHYRTLVYQDDGEFIEARGILFNEGFMACSRVTFIPSSHSAPQVLYQDFVKYE